MDSNVDTNKELGKIENHNHLSREGWLYIFPIILTILLVTGVTLVGLAKDYKKNAVFTDSEEGLKSRHKHEVNFSALLANEEFSRSLRDTVYTDQNVWLELRIDQQMLYVHHRDGRLVKYPVSTGNPYLSKGLESRPGLFAIFMKEDVHLSSQFDNARMNNYMPYNMGIGFHSLQGTGYYGNLGVRPSSHGCTRMRHEDAKTLYGECKIGTLVLVHRGYSARTVAFEPDGFKNDGDYAKEDYIKLMAYNLATLMEGKYFINPPKRLIIDGTIIPKSGITVSSSMQIPDKQLLPFCVAEEESMTDRIDGKYIAKDVVVKEMENTLVSNLDIDETDTGNENITALDVNAETVKKYAHNPLGILPYFGPKK